MQAPDRKIKQYQGVSPAGGDSVRITPQVPGRLLLIIQNTGMNSGHLHFQEACTSGGEDFLFAPGEVMKFDNPLSCPEAAINVESDLGTTWAILESVRAQSKVN